MSLLSKYEEVVDKYAELSDKYFQHIERHIATLDELRLLKESTRTTTGSLREAPVPLPPSSSSTPLGLRPSWASAPEWAQWLAQDEDGRWWWYELEPEQLNGQWRNLDESTVRQVMFPGWSETLEGRPTNG